jgi:hypothetical protein
MATFEALDVPALCSFGSLTLAPNIEWVFKREVGDFRADII